MDALDIIAAIAQDLTSALSAEERYQRLLSALGRIIPYDASALLRLEGDALVPLAARGLTADALGRRFVIREHPRLDIICKATEPVRFPADGTLPDPFDGLLADYPELVKHIHACLGCPLRVGGKLIGALTADAAAANAFDDIDQRLLSVAASVAAAEMQATHLVEALEQSARHQGLIARDLMRDVHLRRGTQLVGSSAAMERLRREIALVAQSDLTVLITGETGVGKELVARSLHSGSARAGAPMLYVNCAALPESLADSELFGHTRGAFTGAIAERAGKFEVAHEGTLFLDEIGELPLSLQPKLLRALQEGEIQRIGSDQPLRVDVRVIAATNRDLEAAVAAGRFRSDLYHRLAVYPIRVPPLRDHLEDLPLLAGMFCDASRRSLDLGPLRLGADAIASLMRYRWPGNVRELDNVLSRAALKAGAKVPPGEAVSIDPVELGPEFAMDAASAETIAAAPVPRPSARERTLKETVRELQRSEIRRTLAAHDGNWAAAARQLGMHRSNLHHLARRLGLR